jgi:hypothetical protein
MCCHRIRKEIRFLVSARVDRVARLDLIISAKQLAWSILSLTAPPTRPPPRTPYASFLGRRAPRNQPPHASLPQKRPPHAASPYAREEAKEVRPSLLRAPTRPSPLSPTSSTATCGGCCSPSSKGGSSLSSSCSSRKGQGGL